jgi:hypothetical protein
MIIRTPPSRNPASCKENKPVWFARNWPENIHASIVGTIATERSGVDWVRA